MRRQYGQAMAEYLVVASALIGAFFWATEANCPGYENCLSQLTTVMHNKYEGYAHSISAVHKYGAYEGEGFESSWTDGGGDDGGDNDGGGGAGVIPQEGLVRSDSLVSLDGSTTYGTLVGGQYIVDGDGNVIGEYNGATGVVTMEDGSEYDGLVSRIVLDENGDEAPLQAVVACSGDTEGDLEVLGFGYESGSTGDFYNSLTLEPMDISGLCKEPSYAVVDTEGNPVSGAIVGTNYYASTLTASIDPDTPRVASGEVVYFDIEVPNEEIYNNSDPAIGELVLDCAVMVTGWDADPGADPLDSYLNADPNPRVGSLDPVEDVDCPAQD